MDAERQAMALLCEHLPALRKRAEDGYWADTLEMHVTEVVGGASALAACEQLGLVGPDPATRGAEGGRLEFLPAPQVVGDYRCPQRRCSRRANRDDQGRPPLCELNETPMVFTTQR